MKQPFVTIFDGHRAWMDRTGKVCDLTEYVFLTSYCLDGRDSFTVDDVLQAFRSGVEEGETRA